MEKVGGFLLQYYLVETLHFNVSIRIQPLFICLTPFLMNETTLMLARIFGPTLGIVGLGMLLNSKFYTKAFKDFGKERFSLVMTTMAMIAIGVVLVTRHFLWDSFPAVLVSIIGLGFLVKGAFLAVLPTAFNKWIDWILSGKILIFAGGLWLVGGAYLSWVGFLG